MSFKSKEGLLKLAHAIRVRCLEGPHRQKLHSTGSPRASKIPVLQGVGLKGGLSSPPSVGLGINFEVEELVSFLKFKLEARPEVFKETIDHMNYYEEANTEISALSVEIKTVENLVGVKSTVEKDDENLAEKKKAEIMTENTVGNLVEESSTVEKDEEKIPSIGGDEIGGKDLRSQNNDNNSRILTADQKKKIVCKFLKRGKCKHGWKGRKFEGQSCSYNHPEVCQSNRLYGKCPDDELFGDCTKIHLHICYEYMDKLSCKYGKENCRFWHPPGLKDSSLDHERKQDTQRKSRNSRVFYGKNQMQHSFLEQNQSPFLEFIGQKNGQQELQKSLRSPEQLELLKFVKNQMKITQ